MERSSARREAYRYILERLSGLNVGPQGRDSVVWIPLDELRQLREGTGDPSTRLVASLCLVLGDLVSPEDIHAHLIAPFESYCSGNAGKV
jgi:hypothetical protein